MMDEVKKPIDTGSLFARSCSPIAADQAELRSAPQCALLFHAFSNSIFSLSSSGLFGNAYSLVVAMCAAMPISPDISALCKVR